MPERELIAAREVAQRNADLVATVSHELRTPLASVLGFVELLLHRELDVETRRRYLQTVHSEAQRLATLIDDFLDLEKIEAGRFTLALEPLDIGELLQHEIVLFSAQSQMHTIEFATPVEHVALIGDRQRIGQVVANLLSNAIKYSPAGGPVVVSLEQREGFVRVEVSDSGLGIPVAQQEFVFTKFFRADSSDTRDIGGTGLGLALCQRIVIEHGGRIGFASTEGAGTTFWFELPSASSARVATIGERVLVIEDDRALATAISDCLSIAGYAVEDVATGALGLASALRVSPSVICLDSDLPGGLDGWQVLVRLKDNPATAHVPVVVCSDASGRTTAATLGAAGFVTKPFAPEELRDAVAERLSAEGTSVLVVGGDAALRRLVVETLARDGGELREAADGLEALAMIAARQPDTLVLDLALPGVAGFGGIKRLLRQTEAQGLSVVVLTGRALSPSETRFLRERNAALLEKRTYSGSKLRRLVQHRASAPRRSPPSVTDIAANMTPDGDSLRAMPCGATPAVIHLLPAGHSLSETETRSHAD